jgi:polyadenylate-binding protein
VWNFAKIVATYTLKKLFSKKRNVLNAKVSWIIGILKSSEFRFVTFSLEDNVDVAISSFNNFVSYLQSCFI